MNQPIDVATAWHEVGERLRAYVSRRVAPEDADDLVQSVMVKLLEHRSDIKWTTGATRRCSRST